MEKILNTASYSHAAKYDGPGKNDDQPPLPTPVSLPYAITGIPTKPGRKGEVPLRQECDAWTNSQSQVDLDQRNLFILALRFYVDMDPLDRDSYWQTAGVFFGPSLLNIT